MEQAQVAEQREVDGQHLEEVCVRALRAVELELCGVGCGLGVARVQLGVRDLCGLALLDDLEDLEDLRVRI